MMSLARACSLRSPKPGRSRRLSPSTSAVLSLSKGSGRRPSKPDRRPREDVRIPIKGVRKSIADAMVRSAFTAPHVSVWTGLRRDCDDAAGRAAEDSAGVC